MRKILALWGPLDSKGKLHIKRKAALGMNVTHGNFFPGKLNIFK